MDLTYYRVCRVRCTCCGDVLERVNRTKTDGGRMMTCSCGKVMLDPAALMYRIVGNTSDYEDLSEKWPEQLDYYIWKAKHQRGLTDKQIDFFLLNHPRWELLPVYARFVRKLGEQGALNEVRQMYGTGTA